MLIDWLKENHMIKKRKMSEFFSWVFWEQEAVVNVFWVPASDLALYSQFLYFKHFKNVKRSKNLNGNYTNPGCNTIENINCMATYL